MIPVKFVIGDWWRELVDTKHLCVLCSLHFKLDWAKNIKILVPTNTNMKQNPKKNKQTWFAIASRRSSSDFERQSRTCYHYFNMILNFYISLDIDLKNQKKNHERYFCKQKAHYGENWFFTILRFRVRDANWTNVRNQWSRKSFLVPKRKIKESI